MSEIMPSLFLGHGSPMNLILENSFTEALEAISRELPTPKAILVISAHWYTTQTAVSISSGIAYETLYDFYGFPPSLYELNYPSPTNNTLSKRIGDLLDVPLIERGLDHGAWMPLHFLFPKANIPIIQLSLNKNLPLALHVKMGEQLKVLREEGIMIIGSGNITHNLGLVDFYNINAPAVEWAKNVDNFVDKAFTCNDTDALIRIESLCPDFKTAHPSIDHYLPLLYIAGTRKEADEVNIITPFFQNASLSMRGFILH
ncbi:putative DOPA dioxygenase [Sulfurospirillum diekertiae]|uniref:DOPA dioxygenase n=1 Tax=Sulfurospirillum diekertiae TaxID=1854492 RepID=A0A290HYH9_9BACT|nr:class III extradiol ring-cleavage dioxygenase [Sulfurospirillum diekertiae]ATB70419.1 putative DOPA dioxygenase [Sulfurospirillum diekertiae]